MTEELGRISVERQSGSERFVEGARDLGFDLLGFWQWSASDLVANTTRGVLAEYLVAKALEVDLDGVRDAWAPYDLLTPNKVRVEVKSAAYLQTWYQEKTSTVAFRTPKTHAWNPDTNQLASTAMRQSDVYVFALLKHDTKATLNPLDVSQWEFYVLSTRKLDERTRSQHSITLKTLQDLSAASVRFDQLAAAVDRSADPTSL